MLITLSSALAYTTLYAVENPIRHSKQPWVVKRLCWGLVALFCAAVAVVAFAPVTCAGFLCSDSGDLAQFGPSDITCEGDPCTANECCITTPVTTRRHATPSNVTDTAIRRLYTVSPTLQACADQVTIAKVLQTSPVIMQDTCSGIECTPTTVRGGDTSRTVIVMGDSHVKQWKPRFTKLNREFHDQMPTVVYVVHNGDLVLPPEIPDIDIMRRDDAWCKNHPESVRCKPDPQRCPPSIPRCVFTWRNLASRHAAMWSVVDRHLDDGSLDAVVIGCYWEHELGAMYWAPADGTAFDVGRSRVVGWPRSHVEMERGASQYPTDTRLILDAWEAKLRSYVARGVKVYVVGPHTTYDDPEFPCHSPPLPLPNATWLGERWLCRWCGPHRIALASPDGRELPENLLDYLRPRDAAEYHFTNSFIADPILDASRRAGAVVLEPESTLCRDGKCPFVKADGTNTQYVCSLHMRATLLSVVDHHFSLVTST